MGPPQRRWKGASVGPCCQGHDPARVCGAVQPPAGAAESGWQRRRGQPGDPASLGCVPRVGDGCLPSLPRWFASPLACWPLGPAGSASVGGVCWGCSVSQLPFITLLQRHLASPTTRGLAEMVALRLHNPPWLGRQALSWLAQYDSHRLRLTGL